MEIENSLGRRPVVLVTGRVNKDIIPMLEPYCDIRHWTKSDAMPLNELQRAIPEAEALVVSYRSRLPREVICQGKQLKIIAQAFVGYEHVDIGACTEMGIPFCNAAGPSINTVAEMAMALTFASARNIAACDRYVREGLWEHRTKFPYLFGFDLQGAVMGIIGMGRIGMALAEKAAACGMEVIYHNRHRRQGSLQYVSLEDLYRQADVVVATLPSTPETYHLISGPAFAAMKESALFINVGRGNTVDTAALVQALQKGEIAQAALDVVEEEPLAGKHPLLQLPNVIVTPHIGSNTRATWTQKSRQTVQNILNRFAGKPLRDCVNPEVFNVLKG